MPLFIYIYIALPRLSPCASALRTAHAALPFKLYRVFVEIGDALAASGSGAPRSDSKAVGHVGQAVGYFDSLCFGLEIGFSALASSWQGSCCPVAKAARGGPCRRAGDHL
ncbi:hypothetical protein DFH11DRAFT_320656 [Phellopilus nigrolimitatus]|nr:hypothetical protein DFH11DRAFT_320656 [Phellopilus nigrolimitatus]